VNNVSVGAGVLAGRLTGTLFVVEVLREFLRGSSYILLDLTVIYGA
jgi:hypothetical protein